MTDRELDRSESEHLAVGELPVGGRLWTHVKTEHRGLSGSRAVQVEIGRVQMHRAIIPVHQVADSRDVIQVRMGQEDGFGLGAPGVERTRDPLRLITGVDDECPTGCVRVSNEKAVRLEGADRQSANFEPAGIAGVQTENEVPQPQEPVAFGLSNVNPDPLKLL